MKQSFFATLAAAAAVALVFATSARSASADTVTGFVPRGAGQGLVVWGGGSVDQLADAVRERGCNLTVAWAQVGDKFIAHIRGAPESVNADFGRAFGGSRIPSNTPLTIVCGTTAAPVAAATPATRLRAPTTAPPITKVTYQVEESMSAADREALEQIVDASLRSLRDYDLGEARAVRVVAYHTLDRLVEVYASDIRRSVQEARALWTTPSARGGNEQIWLNTGLSWWTGRDVLVRQQVIAHELFHVLQGQFSTDLGGRSDGIAEEARRSGPEWLLEGGADYAAARVTESLGGANMAATRLQRRPQTLQSTASLRSMEAESGFAAASPYHYVTGMLAVDLLLQDRGLPALNRYYRQIGTGLINGLRWQTAFEHEFGRSPEAFYREWDAARAKQLEAAAFVSGRVVLAGAGVPDVHVWACPSTRAGDPCSSAATNKDGTYRIVFEHTPSARLMYFGATPNGCTPFGLLGSGGLVTTSARATSIQITTQTTTVPDVTLSAAPQGIPALKLC